MGIEGERDYGREKRRKERGGEGEGDTLEMNTLLFSSLR